MPQRKEIMAQAVYLAQIEAAKGACQCKVCQILRKANDAMTEEFLETPESIVPPAPPA